MFNVNRFTECGRGCGFRDVALSNIRLRKSAAILHKSNSRYALSSDPRSLSQMVGNMPTSATIRHFCRVAKSSRPSGRNGARVGALSRQVAQLVGWQVLATDCPGERSERVRYSTLHLSPRMTPGRFQSYPGRCIRIAAEAAPGPVWPLIGTARANRLRSPSAAMRTT